MARRTLRPAAVFIALAGFAVVLTAGASARTDGGGISAFSEEAPSEFARIYDAANLGGFKPASLQGDRKVKVILKLSGASVGERMAEAKKQGQKLSNAEKAAIRAELAGRQDDVKSRIQALGGAVLAEYQDAYNGVAARVSLGELGTLASLPGVESVHPVRVFERDNTAGVQYINGHTVWGDTGFAGDGVTVAIMDTGVDYTHADFGGPGTEAAFDDNDGSVIEAGTFPTEKVVGGTDLVGDAFNSSSDDPAESTPRPDPDPLDCNGHGTHVAGTAAGFGVLSSGATFGGPYNASTHSSNSFKIGPGVAPEADILAIRVFGCEGSTSEEIIVAALDFALENEADVVNMSLGSPFGRTDEPSAEASNTVSEAGVTVIASAGNSGPSPYVTGAPAVASRAVSVAAIDASSATFPGATMALSTGKTITAINANGASFANGTTLPVKVLRRDGSVSLGCDPNEYVDVAGKLVVTVRGVCARVARAVFGQKAGAAAVAMINNSAGLPPFEGEITGNPDTGEEFTVTIPFLGVRGVLGPSPEADGDDLVAADGGTVTLTNTTTPNPGYQRFASFTSGGWGNLGSAVKPEVTAPGVSVVSAGMGRGTGAATFSGTSMAAPMTTGAAALVRDARPELTPAQVKAALLNTADASTAKIAAGYDVRRGGTGVIDVRKAVDTVGLATTADGTGTLSFGYEALAAAHSETLTFTLSNLGSSDVTYNLTSAQIVDAANTGRRIDTAAVGIAPSSVTVPAGGSADVSVTISLDAAAVAGLPAASRSNFGAIANVRGAILATPTTDGPGVYTLRVPFALVPRGLSNITPGAKAPFVRGKGGTLTSSVPVSNTGIHSGTASLFAWGVQDADDITGAEDAMDVRSVGVQVQPREFLCPPPTRPTDPPQCGTATDRSLVFVINNYGRWSNASVSEYDINIDLQNDGRADFFVVGVDLGAVLAGSFDGRLASFIFDAAGNLINAWVATAPQNGSTLLLPTLASDIGLDHSTKFNYAVAAFSIVPEGLVDVTSFGSFRSHEPPVSSGDTATLAPGATTAFPLTVDKGKNAGNPQLGWLVVTTDDANGAAQADQVALGNP